MRHFADAVYTETDQGPGHVALARTADHILVLPATAHLLSCVANGSGANLIATTILAAEHPVVIVPSMNPTMWRSPPVQRNIAHIREDGHVVVDPVLGRGFEVASRTFRAGPVVPPPEHIIDELSRIPQGKPA
jgi:phosphopantothenoylcysteine decarboxylase/phosphopantothenate--cysteine ligase